MEKEGQIFTSATELTNNLGDFRRFTIVGGVQIDTVDLAIACRLTLHEFNQMRRFIRQIFVQVVVPTPGLLAAQAQGAEDAQAEEFK